MKKNRKKLIKLLTKNKIPYGFHYPYPINKLHSLRQMFKNQKYPNSERLGKECISLPIDPNLSILNLKKIIKLALWKQLMGPCFKPFKWKGF